MAMTRKRMFRIGVYGTLGVAVLILLLNPFTRQAMFGPKIQDLPLCYWQDNFRYYALRGSQRDTPTTILCQWLGFKRHEVWGLPERKFDVLPVLLSLTDDPEPRVRERVASALGRGFAPDECAPTLNHMLDDPEAAVRAAASKSLARVYPESAAAKP
jgi:hypothetical protein